MREKKLNVSKIGGTILKWLGTVFIALRACDVVDWRWYIVLSPLLVRAAIILLAVVVVGVAVVSEGARK